MPGSWHKEMSHEIRRAAARHGYKRKTNKVLPRFLKRKQDVFLPDVSCWNPEDRKVRIFELERRIGPGIWKSLMSLTTAIEVSKANNVDAKCFLVVRGKYVRRAKNMLEHFCEVLHLDQDILQISVVKAPRLNALGDQIDRWFDAARGAR